MGQLPEPRTVETVYLAALLEELRQIKALLGPSPTAELVTVKKAKPAKKASK